jgi:Uncharacterized protein containing a Zn-finger-like domain
MKTKEHYKFVQNRQCEYFPCHKDTDENDFNCLFCFCPLYMLGSDCGGNYEFLDDGTKDCSNCRVSHSPAAYEYVTGQWYKINVLVKQREEGKR